MAGPLSIAAFGRAKESIVAGVNSPVRSFSAVGDEPVVVARGGGPYLYDLDGRRYVDYLMSWGALILGHAYPEVTLAIREALERGTGYGLSTEAECELAELIRQAFPSIELLRLVNSGTEAVMTAVRLARGHTGRSKIVKFEGCYHGHSDGLLVNAGSGLATFSVPSCAGVPATIAGETLMARYNDLGSVESLAAKHGGDIACVLVEPVAGNMGVVPPADGFLAGLREICDRIGALLIFDEVITGFRVAWGGAQEKYGVRADITTLGKIIGAGLPVGAVGGRRDIMEKLAPLGPVYQAGTLAGNPVVATAGAAVLRVLQSTRPYASLERAAHRLSLRIERAADSAGVALRVARVGSMFTVFFSDQAPRDYRSARASDTERYAAFFRHMLESDVLLPPSQFEAAFVSASHTDDQLEATIAAAQDALERTAQEGRGRRHCF